MADSIKSLKIWWSMADNVHQIFSDFINCNSFNSNLSFSQTNIFLSHFTPCCIKKNYGLQVLNNVSYHLYRGHNFCVFLSKVFFYQKGVLTQLVRMAKMKMAEWLFLKVYFCKTPLKWIDNHAILCPFQKYFSQIRTIGGGGGGWMMIMKGYVQWNPVYG